MDTEDNSIMMWHCGPASKRFCQKNGYRYGLNYFGKDHGGADLDHAVGTGIIRIWSSMKEKLPCRLTGRWTKCFGDWYVSGWIKRELLWQPRLVKENFG